ncbi:MAG: type IX secretion system sortase PorU [Bacteroidales bacterium]|nr:type IX secretion system sortase PorU [Bacteroidales bacterium]
MLQIGYRTMRKWLNILLYVGLMMFGTAAEAQSYATNSVLKDGSIYKIGVVKDGVYRITFDELTTAGIDVNTLNLNKISMFGNVNGMLPEGNDIAAYDDLTEMDIMVDTNGILFYGQGPIAWTRLGDKYAYHSNYYSDTTFYFLKIDNQDDGKRMQYQPQEADDYQAVITDFVDKQYHEIDRHNYYHRGRKWFGETVNIDDGEIKIPFVFKNVLTEYQGSVDICFIGASKTDGTKARLKVNGIQLGDDINIQAAGTYSFGVEKTINAAFTPLGDDVEVELEIVSDNSAPYLGLDYISVNARRSLSYVGEQLQFGFNRLTHPIVELVSITDVGDGAVILDVSSPLSPKIQEFSMSGDVVGFKYLMSGSKDYVLYKDADILNVVSIQHIDNQNIHSITNAEMLIITDKIFAEQAQAIKAIHEEDEGLLTKVVFIDEIYNEFSSGSLDITAIRNFVKMVYQRSADLRYVLLLGRGTNDYKNVEGYGFNFVPPYEAMNSVNENTAYVTDDYFGLMDEDEGDSCEGLMDVCVSRMPVLTPEEADVAVDKIRRYMYDAKTRGEWRNEMLLVADDKKMYARNSDAIEAVVDTMNTTANISKIYADSYVRQKLSDGSYCYPDATASLIEKFNEGIMMMTYLGHGGVKGLSASNLFKVKDIESLTNYYKLPLVVTGTCEFSAFDNASLVSAGEILYKMDNGGAIAMYTTARPTQADINKNVVKAFVVHTYENGNIKNLTMGDVALMTKKENKNNSANYLSYVMFGDPALRFVYPDNKVVIDAVNGMPTSQRLSVAPMDTLMVEGRVTNSIGALDASFNGIVYVKMFDNKSTCNTLNNAGESGNDYTYTNYSDVLYDGCFSVVNGMFSCHFAVPRNVNNQDGDAKLSFYAMDTINGIEANTFFKNIKVDGNPTVLPDIEGPEINLTWNDGHLSAALHDPQGICHYNSMLGRDIVLQIESGNFYKSLIVNDEFEQNIDDFTSGRVEIDLDFLEVGENVLSMRAWDTHGNSNTASITVNVADNESVKTMHNVVNYPNPFSESTCITIDYDKNNVTVDVDIQIFDIAGRMVNTLEYKDLNAYNLKLQWDGRDGAGRHLPAGVYIYKVYLTDSEGFESNTSQRMIIL